MEYGKIFLVLEFLSIIYFICQLIAVSYFARVTRHELRPYFEDNDMDNDVRHAKLVFGYLCAMAGITAVNCVIMSLNMFHRKLMDQIAYALAFASWAAVLGLGVAASVYACDWWKYFDGEGLVHLARLSHGIAAAVIAIMALGWFLMFVIVLVTLRSRVQQKLFARRSDSVSV